MADGGASKPEEGGLGSLDARSLREPAELRQELEQLRRSNLLLERMLAASGDIVMQVSPDGTITFVNRVLPGFDRDDVLGSSLFDYVEASQATAVRDTVARVCQSRMPQESVVVGPGAHGERRTYLSRFNPILSEEEVTGLVINTTDISALQTAETALREQKHLIELAAAASGLGVWTALPDGSGSWNEATRRIWGFAEGEAVEPTWDEVFSRVHPDDVEAANAAVTAAFESDEGRYELEHRLRLPDGSIRWVLALGRVFRDEGSPPRLVGTILDITERKRMELRLQQAQRLESVGRLAGGIAHDFNNLLTTITAAVELASAQTTDASITPFLDDVRLAADRSAELIRQLLAVARRQVVEPRVVAPSNLVRRVESLMRRLLGETIELQIDDRASGLVRVDPSQVEQVLMNLLTNARDSMPRGGRVRLSVHDETVVEREAPSTEPTPGNYVVVRVEDEGEGIAPESLRHVFEPFFTTKDHGTGLGLATCYGIVKQNGGQILVDSKVGRGTRLDVYFPRCHGAPVDEAPSEAITAPSGGRTVLLAEDEPSLRKLLALTLREAGYQVISAADGQEALERAGAYPDDIDLVISDVVMPRLGGPDLVSRLVEERPGLAVIYTSGWTADAIPTAPSGDLSERLHLLQKPFTPSALVGKIAEVLGEADED